MSETGAAQPGIRIVMATDSLDPSGVGEHMLTLASELQSRYDVVMAYPSSEQGGRFLSRAARRRLGVKRIDAGDEAETAHWLRGSGASLLHVHAGIGWEGHGLARLAQAAGLPVIRTEHLPYVITDEQQRVAHRDGMDLVDGVIAVSAAAAQTYAAAGVASAKLHTVRNGIRPFPPSRARSAVRKELGLTRTATLLLTVARFSPQKGHATLIAALPEVLRRHPLAVLLLVGAGPEQPLVEAQVEELGIAASVRFLGSRSDVSDLLGAADLFVLPSHFEGMPLALLEAMSAGLPVAATRIGGAIEATGEDHPFLAPAGDAEALAAVILDALSDPRRMRAVGLAAQRRFQKEYHASRMAAETSSLYSLLGAESRNAAEKRTGMTKTRIGFIGAGGIAQRHLGVLQQFDDVELTAFSDPDFGRAEEAAARFGARAYEKHQDMLAHEKLDAIFICIPPFAHGPAEEDVIAQGLPFFVEKPLSIEIELAERIAASVERAGLVSAVGYHWRYLDTVDEARRLLAERPAQLVSGYWLDQTPPPRWWWREDQSGGQMVEQATHILDLARYLVGDVTQVFAMTGHAERADFPDLDVPTVSTASLRFASGAIGNLGATCLLRWGHRVGLHLFGDGLAIELSERDLMVDVGAGRPTRAAEGDPFWREDRDFIDAVRGGENRIRSPYGEALKTHRLAAAVGRSAVSKQAVDLG